MSRKRPRRAIVPMPPRGLRPRLPADQVRDLGIVHVDLVDTVRSGRATEQTLWEVVEAALTWCRVAELLGVGEPEMRSQLELATCLVERYGATGRIAFEGCEYDVARVGCMLMDSLAELVDQPTAMAATEWSSRKVSALASACVRRQGAAS